MPFLSMNKGSKKFGIQTYARATALMPEIRDVELEYVNLRDWYVNELARRAQFQEALEQAKATGDRDLENSAGGKINAIDSNLTDMKERVRLAGERSWAEAYYLVASKMLPGEVRKQLSIETDNLIGRTRHELKRHP